MSLPIVSDHALTHLQDLCTLSSTGALHLELPSPASTRVLRISDLYTLSLTGAPLLELPSPAFAGIVPTSADLRAHVTA